MLMQKVVWLWMASDPESWIFNSIILFIFLIHLIQSFNSIKIENNLSWVFNSA